MRTTPVETQHPTNAIRLGRFVVGVVMALLAVALFAWPFVALVFAIASSGPAQTSDAELISLTGGMQIRLP